MRSYCCAEVVMILTVELIKMVFDWSLKVDTDCRLVAYVVLKLY